MENSVQANAARVERNHWWYRGRRRMIRSLIEALGARPGAQMLDVGCGTGANLTLLAELGFVDVIGVDLSEDAIRWCCEKGHASVERGDLCDLPFPEAHFDFVLAIDILEHVTDEITAIAELRRVLRPGGTLLVTVPALRGFWGIQGSASYQKRSYQKWELAAHLRQGGFTVTQSFYFNYLLLGPIWIAQQLSRRLGIQFPGERRVNSRWMNAILGRIFAIDVWSAPYLRPGFGASVLAVARCR
jgi:SAM-dependent methyltransferase